MTATMIEFVTKDAEGAAHSYVIPFKTADDRGIEISLWFLANLGSIATGLVPMLKGAIDAWLKQTGATTISELLDADASQIWTSLAEGLTPDAISGVAKELRSALLSKDAVPIIRDLFNGGSRDNVPLVPATIMMNYRGNWIEFYSAVWKVVLANGFFPWPNTSKITSG